VGNQRLIDKICELCATLPTDDRRIAALLRSALTDTLAVTYAGWNESSVRHVAEAYGVDPSPGPLDLGPVDPEVAALLLGTAAHALDYDDVHLASSAHPSAPLFAALLPVVRRDLAARRRLPTAFAVGLAVNIALGRILGKRPFLKGWHSTTTIGPLSAAAALCHLHQCSEAVTAHALSLAVAQAAGFQRNFGSMAKPVQVGFAAAAAVRAVRLARSGVTGARDPFGPKGYFDLYGAEALARPPDEIALDLREGGLCVKLYPCCYMSHRPALLALRARRELDALGVEPAELDEVVVEGPDGAFSALNVTAFPTHPDEGKFCGAFVVACALLDGSVGLEHFRDRALLRPDVTALFPRIRLTTRPPTPGEVYSPHVGSVTLVARARGQQATAETLEFPGSPELPVTDDELETKVRDCLACYSGAAREPVSHDSFQKTVTDLCAP
jgi:2-methylcitrate dehydratase PrpD